MHVCRWFRACEVIPSFVMWDEALVPGENLLRKRKNTQTPIKKNLRQNKTCNLTKALHYFVMRLFLSFLNKYFFLLLFFFGVFEDLYDEVISFSSYFVDNGNLKISSKQKFLCFLKWKENNGWLIHVSVVCAEKSTI